MDDEVDALWETENDIASYVPETLADLSAQAGVAMHLQSEEAMMDCAEQFVRTVLENVQALAGEAAHG